MKKKTKRKRPLSLAGITALVLAILMLITALVSCAPDKDTEVGDETTLPVESETQGEESTIVKDDLPEGLNYANKPFIFLAWNQSTTEYFTEGTTGDIVDDAIYNRNLTVESRLGVRLDYKLLDGNSSSFNQFCATAENSILAGGGDYDAIACYSRSAGVLTVKGVLSDLLDSQYLNFEKPWWPDSLLELNTLNDSLYFMSGDIATSLIYQLTFLIVNNNLLDTLSLSNPQELVGEGNWTIDQMMAMCEGVYSDLDASGTKSLNDRYGLVVSNHPLLDAFFFGSGTEYIATAADGSLTISDKYFTEKNISLVDSLNKLIWTDNDGIYNRSFTNAINAQGTSLFYVVLGATLASTEFRNAAFEYSILPSPKFDQSQENYRTAVGFPHSMYCVPIDAKDAEMSGAVMECLAYESYRTVTPALFDTAFKYKYTNTRLDADMFEIIRSTVQFDLCRFFFDALGGDGNSPIRTLRQQVENNTNIFASQRAKLEKLWSNSLENIYNTIIKLP